ncbi:hypothetical protein K239x_00080 [Planctomycetes bacterium K23_9]|uniref:Uncharacterized protein n=2 Tax=Stieleria marina TaxID=1930275 RepID=A0A517NLW7_9BACT|nr:hypothetical protein K239x_00080 [Planctomycetes bacterium K23_9]
MLSLFAVGSTGCATIVSEKRYPVTVTNTQAPTYFSIQNRKNETIHQGVTPQQVTLDAKAFPFWPAKYSVVFAGNDATTQTVPLKAKIDPWVAGNIVIGGVAGTVIDGATGAMFKLPAEVKGQIPPQFAVTDVNQGFSLAAAAVKVPAAAPVVATVSGQGVEPKVQTASARVGDYSQPATFRR